MGNFKSIMYSSLDILQAKACSNSVDVIIYLDFSKVFNSVPRNDPLQTLET